MTENCISLINAGLDKTAGQIQYRQFLNKGRVNQEIAVPRKTFQGTGLEITIGQAPDTLSGQT